MRSMTLIQTIIEDLAFEGEFFEVIISGVKYRLKWVDNKYMVIRDNFDKQNKKDLL
jgi:hypothetical protein